VLMLLMFFIRIVHVLLMPYEANKDILRKTDHGWFFTAWIPHEE